MPRKPKAAKPAASKPVKKAPVKKATKATAKMATASRVTAKSAFHIVHNSDGIVLTDRAPAAGDGSKAFASFSEARAAGIDALVRTIEAAEAQLHALKRATSYDAWRDGAAE